MEEEDTTMEDVEESGSARKKPRFSNNREIDEDLHSAQLAVYGRETMMKLLDSKVLISGMQGLGVEIAKNIILAGVKSVTLHDENEVKLWDLASSFVYSEVDVGRNRALASLHKLKELNNDVAVETLTGKLTKEQLSGFKAVVFVDTSFERATEFDDYCHKHIPPIAFIKADVRGLLGSLFCDFGPHFTVLDVDGEKPHSAIIASVSNGNHASVSCVDDGVSLGFQDRDLVVFSEVEGMAELNDGKPREINNVKPHSFVLDEDTTSFGKYLKGGIVTQVQQPKVLHFKPLREAIKNPGDFLHSDVSKPDRPPLLHLAFQALDSFLSKVGRFPLAGSEEDSQELVSIATDINESSAGSRLEDVDSNVLRHLAFGSRAVLNPMAAMFGGIVGQEVVKACSGKFHPIFQFFYFDSLESLPKEPLDPLEFRPQNSRYDAQISVFGSTLQKKLENARVFVVGAGAHGCEFLKNLALMGVSCGDQGKLTVTDDDVIQKSNLGHQFLFRDWNIGRVKSTVAAAAAAGINSCLKIDARQNRVGPETDNVFCDSFWQNLTVVVNALDNVTKRPYVDSRCLQFQKPMLESETLGAKCNTHMVIPHITESYGASRDPPEKQAPMCTVHSFPHNIDHCLEWARSEFEGLFEKTPAEVNDYLSSSDRVKYFFSKKIVGDAQARDTLGRVFECLKEKCESFQDCIKWARLRFEDYFVNRVKQLIFTFPEDAKTSTGALFWSAPKRFPRPLQFSSNDPSHTNFVRAAAILRANTFRIVIPELALTSTGLAEAVNKVDVPKFNLSKDTKIVTDEKATTLFTASVDHSAEITDLINKIAVCVQPEFKMNLKPIQLEKDDDTNHHMDMIVGLANMRARNYKVPEMDKLKAKVITGRIIPAIATSTAMATGFVCLELYKVLDGAHKLEDYRNIVANLALPHFSIAQPVPVEDFNVLDLVNSISKIDPILPFESGRYTYPPNKVDLEIFQNPTYLRIEKLNPKYSPIHVRTFFEQRGINPLKVTRFGKEGGYDITFKSHEDLKSALAYEGDVLKKEYGASDNRLFFTRVDGRLSAYLIRGLNGLGTERTEIENKLKSRFQILGAVKIFIPPQELIDFAYMYVKDNDGKRVSSGEEAKDYLLGGNHISVKCIIPTDKLKSIMSQISW